MYLDRLKEPLQGRSLLPSPAHRLPPEILGYTFRMLNDSLEEKDQWLQPSNTILLLAISGTCKRWREIALSIPFIWSIISIRFKKELGNQAYWRRLNTLTKLFTERSQTFPLKLILHLGYLLSLDDNDDAVQVLKTLVQHSERWHTVEFQSTTQAVIAHQVFNPVLGRLPILTNLTLYGGIERERASTFRCDLFSVCPALTSFSCEPAGLLTNYYLLPWKQIRSLEVIYAYTADMVSTTSLYPKLERLTVTYCGGTWLGDPVLIPGVTCLSVVAENADEAYCAFKHLTLPRLYSLEISFVADYVGEGTRWKEWDEQHIIDFFERSAGCAVTSLSLRCVPVSDEQLIQFLRFMPAPSSLTLEESANDESINANRTITQRFLQRLTVSHHDPSTPLLCKLTNIKLVLHDDGLVENVLPNALISRWIPDVQGVESIRSAYIFVIAKGKEFAMTRKSIKVLISKLRVLKHAGVLVRAGLAVRRDYFDR